jgi:bifunctional NMN adenylyltransferase/nudix hydrolase
MLPQPVFEYVRDLMNYADVGGYLRESARAQDAYLARWGKGPFVTVDAVVLSAGHVILGKRDEQPGRGQYALPGGFLMPDERIVDGMVRELIEETGIKLQPLVIKRNIRSSLVVDDPKRGGRGRNITHAYLIVLNDRLDEGLPKLVGADDLKAPRWVPLHTVPWNMMFEDHGLILEHMLRHI